MVNCVAGWIADGDCASEDAERLRTRAQNHAASSEVAAVRIERKNKRGREFASEQRKKRDGGNGRSIYPRPHMVGERFR